MNNNTLFHQNWHNFLPVNYVNIYKGDNQPPCCFSWTISSLQRQSEYKSFQKSNQDKMATFVTLVGGARFEMRIFSVDIWKSSEKCQRQLHNMKYKIFITIDRWNLGNMFCSCRHSCLGCNNMFLIKYMETQMEFLLLVRLCLHVTHTSQSPSRTKIIRDHLK